MDRMRAARFMREAPALGFAIDRDTLLAAVAELARAVGVEEGGEGGFQSLGVEATEEALEGGSMGRVGGGKAEGEFDGVRLSSAPFGDGKQGAMIGKEGGNGEGEDGGEGVAGALATSGVRDEGEGGAQVGSGKSNAGVGSCGEVDGIGRLHVSAP
jgi:hypothetical protein